MPLDPDLLDLVRNPRETLDIELKADLDLEKEVVRADLARAVCGLSNSGGGYIVVGIGDDRKSAQVPNAEIRFHLNEIANILHRYLEPQPACDVSFVEGHPIIRVPSHGTTPTVIRRDGPPDTKQRPQVVRKGEVYVRRIGPNGPETAPLRSPEEWRAVIRRCTLADREDLLSQFRGLLEPSPSRSAQPAPDPLAEWNAAARAVFLAPGPLGRTPALEHIERNHMLLSYAFLDARERPSIAELLAGLRRANREVRDTVKTGWSMFQVADDVDFAPRSALTGSTGECLQAGPLPWPEEENAYRELWRSGQDGRSTVLRPLHEDGFAFLANADTKQDEFSRFLLARSLTELLRHARAMSVLWPSASRLRVVGEWTGLKGRRLRLDEQWPRFRGEAVEDQREAQDEFPIAALKDGWPEIVSDLGGPVVRAFALDGDLFTPEYVRAIAPKFRM